VRTLRGVPKFEEAWRWLTRATPVLILVVGGFWWWW